MKKWLYGGAIAATILLGMAAIWALQTRIDSQRAAIYQERDDLLLRSPSLLKHLSLEYAPLVGAIYWTRAVQYYGEKHQEHDMRLQLLWPLLDIATTLDPKLIPAYRFGSTFLSEPPPRGAGRSDLAVTLLERGIRANPEQWRLWQDLGNVYYFDAKNYAKAADAFVEGSKNSAAPIWMKAMAAKIAAEGETPETSYALWLDVYQTTVDPAVKKNAESHLRVLKTELDCKALDRLAGQYEKKLGHRPTRVNELVEAGLLREIPRDPAGYPYAFGEDGKAEINLKSPMMEETLAKK